ncbi:unnamed protein product [Lactuca saligna]|uniref:Uncharacterized protein n=1 Tax=Lactuca saligna TaxID=75948 RepID=A0AA35YAD9_LACSI|nr:unnamed protein product [Lactuca saligna]
MEKASVTLSLSPTLSIDHYIPKYIPQHSSSSISYINPSLPPPLQDSCIYNIESPTKICKISVLISNSMIGMKNNRHKGPLIHGFHLIEKANHEQGSDREGSGCLSSSCASSVSEGRCEGGESKGGCRLDCFLRGNTHFGGGFMLGNEEETEDERGKGSNDHNSLLGWGSLVTMIDRWKGWSNKGLLPRSLVGIGHHPKEKTCEVEEAAASGSSS